MQRNDLFKKGDFFYRVIVIKESNLLVIDCLKQHMPYWVSQAFLEGYVMVSEEALHQALGIHIPDYDGLSNEEKKVCRERYHLISPVLVFLEDDDERFEIIHRVFLHTKVSKQTIRKYLILYLRFNNMSILRPSMEAKPKELSEEQKSFRWAINKFYYTSAKLSLKRSYLLLLKHRYTNDQGKLMESYPPFHRFSYFFQKTRKTQTELISREGLSNYQRNHRPLLGEVRNYVQTIGTGMIDSTILDIYIVNDAGAGIGRPLLSAMVDAFTGMCMGYYLSLEGGMFSIHQLLKHVIEDKVVLAKSFGIAIEEDQWKVSALPSVIITDCGREYLGNTFEQLLELGIKVIHLPPYRPELKSKIEQFLGQIQELYKPHLQQRGVIYQDFQERGGKDYRKQASLTMYQLEKVILHSIMTYNNSLLIDLPAFTDLEVKPFRYTLWNHHLQAHSSELIKVDKQLLYLTLLPRQKGLFTRKGLVVNKLRYKAEGYKEQFLNGGEVIVAYDPTDVSKVWLIHQKNYHPFELIQEDFIGKSTHEVSEEIASNKNRLKMNKSLSLQGQIDLINNIELNTTKQFDETPSIQGMRANRQRERKQIRRRITK
jgi:putative transposase